MLLGAFFDVKNPTKVGEHRHGFEATRSTTRSRLRLRTDSEGTGPPHGQPRVLVAPSNGFGRQLAPRGVYTLACELSEGFRPNRVPRVVHFGARSPGSRHAPPLRRWLRADLALRDRFGGRARGPGAGPSGAASHVLLATGGRRSAGNTATWCPAGVRTELRGMVSRPCCGGWWEQGAPATLRRILKGNEAHGRTEPWSRRQRRDRATGPDDGARP